MSADAASAPQRYSRVMACAICQHRKIKCDRKEPCSNCVKANVPCTPGVPTPPRRRRRPNQDLRERLARCEGLLLQCAGTDERAATHSAKAHFPLTPSTHGAPEPEPPVSRPSSDGSPQSPRPAGMMVQDESGLRFMDSHIWTSIYDELQGMRDIVDTEDRGAVGATSCEDAIHDSGVDLLLSGDDPTIRAEYLQPDPVHVFRLWQLFLDRVNPLGKVIHVPTVQPYVMEAAAKISNVSLPQQALLFSIYAIAITSVSDDECAAMFNMSRDTAVHRFTLGAKLSLIRFNFLKNYDMAVLQALILFLWSLQGRHDRYRAWIISGVIVRIAQKAGYHRDGEFLNLKPFETEMRRRIWWQIVVLDSTLAMASGLSPSLLPMNWDTKEPLNLNDADLFPNSTEPLYQRQGPTEMAFCLILHRVYKLSIAAASPAGEMPSLGEPISRQASGGKSIADGVQATLAKASGAAAELDRAVRELEEKYVDPKAGNAHVAALGLRPMLIKKLDGMAPCPERPGSGLETSSAEENVFRTLVASLEHGCEAYEQMAACKFEWSMKLHFRLDMFAAFTGQLHHRPTGPLSDRGWKVVEKIYHQHPELFDMTQKQNIAQAHYALRSWNTRETAITQAGQRIEKPPFIDQLQEALLALDCQASWQSSWVPPSTLMQELSPLDHLVEGSGPSEPNWASWGDSLADSGGQLPQTSFASYLGGDMNSRNN
ncbi:fungal-specific transcription factor domain-containing protein [Dactylonectria macrodidyma]|uniref:Fungal-specific transcription factor domain-containing protein n=1 Tax=Dactylonectria macrodidyma TaxID=307937 RepID=A0A9P9DPU4_9HYPO|nr:fungal-specific transcription factor domain-containing protein [Dactylonectria macrodidyma]